MNEESKTPEADAQTEATEPAADAVEASDAQAPEAEAAVPEVEATGDTEGPVEAGAAESDVERLEQQLAEMVEAAVAVPGEDAPAEEPAAAEPVGDDAPAEEAPAEEVRPDTDPEAEAASEPQAEAEEATEPTTDEVVTDEPAAGDAAVKVTPEDEPAAEPEAVTEPETPDYDYDTLHNMNVHQLQEVAEGVDHEAVHGFTTMHKEELLHALCLAFGLEEHVHHEVVGIDKVAVKAKIVALKLERDEALAAGDKQRLKRIRRRIHNLKHRIRKATV